MILTKQEYCDKFGISIKTLESRVKNEQMPSYHQIKRLHRRGMVIVIVNPSDNCKRCESYFHASVEFNQRKKGYKATTGEVGRYNAELAAEICVKYDLGATKFFKMHNLL